MRRSVDFWYLRISWSDFSPKTVHIHSCLCLPHLAGISAFEAHLETAADKELDGFVFTLGGASVCLAPHNLRRDLGPRHSTKPKRNVANIAVKSGVKFPGRKWVPKKETMADWWSLAICVFCFSLVCHLCSDNRKRSVLKPFCCYLQVFIRFMVDFFFAKSKLFPGAKIFRFCHGFGVVHKKKQKKNKNKT